MKDIPQHLKKYIVEQHYEKYTPVDQACWRYILRQLRAFLSTHAHESYAEGLHNTGVEIEQIPRIENISKKLSKFGWRALPVSGFIPPAAFMELQSLGVLPIACDMRTIEHLSYTPAPDIVHEAAGHAPLLVNHEFSEYLRQYALVAKKAIISKEDMALYEGIRKLSDLKESPDSTEAQVQEAQEHLNHVSKSISHVSEASLLSRMNWWTAEYGLVGDIENPKIFGAGLLSSVGESQLCLSAKVKKIPLTVECIKYSYDITEQQPQLFVAPSFKKLGAVLEQMASQMSFRVGGLSGIEKAIQSETVNTVELNSGLQLSGQVSSVIVSDSKQPIYLRLQGPSQLSYRDQELSGHSQKTHSQGFGTPIGKFQDRPTDCPSTFTEADLQKLGLIQGKKISLKFVSGVLVEGVLKSQLHRDGKLLLLAFENCRVTHGSQILFEPEWGTFDMAVGSQVTSVFGGPADRGAYGETQDFVAARVPSRNFTDAEKSLHADYLSVRKWREQKLQGEALNKSVLEVTTRQQKLNPQDWLLTLECYELLLHRQGDAQLKQELLSCLQSKGSALKTVIENGLALAKQL